MRIPIKALCEEKRRRIDGKALIYLQYFHDGEHRTFLNTGLAISPGYWDKRRQCVKETLPPEFGDPNHLNKEVNRQLRLASDLIVYVQEQQFSEPGAFVKEKFSPSLSIDELIRQQTQANLSFVPETWKKKTSFFLELDKYAKSKEKKVKKATITIYNNMIGHFQAFEQYRKEPITFTCLDYAFYEDFVDFLTFKYQLPRKKIPSFGVRLNTIGKTIHHFRMFIIDRVKRKIIPTIDLSDFKVPAEDMEIWKPSTTH